MNWLAILNEVFDIAWLLALLLFLILIWRSSELRRNQAEQMEKTVLDVAKQDADSARQAVEATRTLAAVLQNEQARNEAK